LRNRAVHFSSVNIDVEEVEEYVRSAVAVAHHFDMLSDAKLETLNQKQA
jgi:hypothetical protein